MSEQFHLPSPEEVGAAASQLLHTIQLVAPVLTVGLPLVGGMVRGLQAALGTPEPEPSDVLGRLTRLTDRVEVMHADLAAVTAELRRVAASFQPQAAAGTP